MRIVSLANQEKLKVSLFQLPASYKEALAKIAAKSTLEGSKKSINTCILEAITSYTSIEDNDQPNPELKLRPLSPYTVRMTESMKASISSCAARWQLKSGIPTSMNAVVNTAISLYIQNN